MKTPQILTGQQAIDQFGLNALIECRVAITTEINGLGHSVMQIGVIADPDNCFIDLSDEPAVLYVEVEQDDDWHLYPIMTDEQFVLQDDKNQPASNELLARRVVELTETVTVLNNKLAAKPSDSGYAALLAERDALTAEVEHLQKDRTRIELSVLAQRNFITMPTAAVPVFNEIFKEIDYQNEKWGEQHIRSQTVEGHLLVLRKELQEAEDGWMKNLTGRNSVESEITQVAAVAIQALINFQLRNHSNKG